MVSESTGNAFEISCKAWDCSHCSIFRRAVAAELISGGIMLARRRGEKQRFLTLTPPSEGLMLSELGVAWNRLRSTLKKNGLLREYVAVVELQSRGEPHLHVIATGEFIPQCKLATWGEAAGFGPITDIRMVRDGTGRGVTGYVLKELAHDLASYVTKSRTEQLKARAACDSISKRKQVRPIRPSRGWYPGGFKAAEKVVMRELNETMGREQPVKDEGPWYVVVRRSDGELSVLNRPAPVERSNDGTGIETSVSGVESQEVEASAPPSQGWRNDLV